MRRVLSSIHYLLIVPGIPMAAFGIWMHWFVRRRERRVRRPFEHMQRPAGWSLQNRMSALMEDFTLNFMFAMMAGLVAWAFAVSNGRNVVLFLSLGLLVCSVFSVFAGRKLCGYANHRLGLLGEQVVGQLLDALSSDSVRVFHDLEVSEPGSKNWNIDHVVLTPSGVFAIETKTRRKPREIGPDGQKGHKVIFDGNHLIFPHPMKPDRHGLDQTQRNASWLSDKLTALNARPIEVLPVLVLPGWWIEANARGPVSVLNPKGLASFLKGRSAVFSVEQQRAIANQLEERCRIDLSRP